MADVASTVNSVVGGIVSLIKGLVVFFVFAISNLRVFGRHNCKLGLIQSKRFDFLF